MKVWVVLGFSGAVSSLLFSCATVRIVKTLPGRGGEITLNPGLWGDARAEADKVMAQNCNGDYQIMEEGEVIVGSVTKTDDENKQKGQRSGSVATTTDRTEHRIKYECKGSKKISYLYIPISE